MHIKLYSSSASYVAGAQIHPSSSESSELTSQQGKKMSSNEKLDQQSKAILTKYVMAATATGAIPVPAVSAALVAENALMINHIASNYGCEISLATVVSAIGLLGTANMIGRQVFIEVARALSWGAAFTGAPVLVSAIGAGTAGLQTYLIGLLAIEMAKGGGQKLSRSDVTDIFRKGKEGFDDFKASA
jgi:hypothetical protein